jgi:hypothetical protein
MEPKFHRLLPADVSGSTVQLPPHHVCYDLTCVVLETFQAYFLSQR